MHTWVLTMTRQYNICKRVFSLNILIRTLAKIAEFYLVFYYHYNLNAFMSESRKPIISFNLS